MRLKYRIKRYLSDKSFHRLHAKMHKYMYKNINAADLTIDNCDEGLRRMLDMTYAELVDHLLQKYGPSQYDYFCNESCKGQQPKAKRTQEGLFLHHIDEDKGILLSDSKSAILYPYEYQKADRLVYCDYLEHLILHFKIWLERDRNNSMNGIGGAYLICIDLNNFYESNQFSDNWRKYVQEKIAARYDEYVIILKWFFMKVLEDERITDLGKGGIFTDYFSGGNVITERDGFKRQYAGKLFKTITGKELNPRMLY